MESIYGSITAGKTPAGYQSVLTKEQWLNILDFVKAIDAKLLVSVSNCAGDHEDNGPLDLTQTKKLFALTYEYGSTIDAVEFMNEPNMLQTSGAPEGYICADYVRDHDIFNAWVRENYPECLIVGLCNTGMADESADTKDAPMLEMGSGMGNTVYACDNPGTEGAHVYCHSRKDGKKVSGTIELQPGTCSFIVV